MTTADRGDAHRHPAVTEMMAAGPPPRRPSIVHVRGVDVLAYSVPRFTLSRRLVEMLPQDGVILQHVAPQNGPPCWVAMTRAEFESAFAKSRRSISWEFGYYTAGRLPEAARPFLVV